MTIVLDGSKGISIPEGSVSEPAIRGLNSNTGISYVNNDIIFTANGTERLKLAANGDIIANGSITANAFAVTLGAGTVSAPSLTVSGDTNTGMFFPAADTIAFTEGGVEAMRLTANGNVGIGNTSPDARLTVTGTANISGNAVISGTLLNTRLPTSVIVANTSANAGVYYYLGANTVTLTLPLTPSVGDQVGVAEINGGNASIVARNGSNIMSIAEDLDLNIPYAAFRMVYVDSTRGWVFT
jgi:hypothetical protein